MATSTIKKMDYSWKLIGTATGKSQSVTVSSSLGAKELLAVIFVNGAKMTSVIPYNEFGGAGAWNVFGYHFSGSDYGMVNLNVTNGTAVAIRNCIYGGNDVSANAKLSIYYR